MLQQCKTFIAFAIFLSSYIVLGTLMFLVGQKDGIARGEAQYHNRLIEELDQKGGAPVLLYPPTPPVHKEKQ